MNETGFAPFLDIYPSAKIEEKRERHILPFLFLLLVHLIQSLEILSHKSLFKGPFEIMVKACGQHLL